GTMTKDGDCAVVDVCIRSLASGGRAAIIVGPGLLTRGGETLRFRKRLATTYRLVGVFRLPAGVLSGTAVAPALVVIERKLPTDTIFAVLEDDWSEQLQAGGALYEAYRSHRDGSPQ